MDTLTAQNIFLDENTGGKGRHFTSRFLQPGLVKYSFGVCLLSKETIDKFIYQFVGCPVIINHKDVTNESAKDDRMGVVSRVWFDQMDGWYWCEGIIFEEQAISLIEDGYNVSCQYEITEYSNNTTKALHNGNPYDKVILNGKPEHLAIVKTPRYEAAMIAVNALDLTAENEDKWITVHPNGEDAKGKHLLLKEKENGKLETPKEAIDRVYKKEDKGEYKESSEKFDIKTYTENKPIYIKSSKGNLLSAIKKDGDWYAQGNKINRESDIEYLDKELDKVYKGNKKTYERILEDTKSEDGLWDSGNLSESEKDILDFLLKDGTITRQAGEEGKHDTANGTARWVYHYKKEDKKQSDSKGDSKSTKLTKKEKIENLKDFVKKQVDIDLSKYVDEKYTELWGKGKGLVLDKDSMPKGTMDKIYDLQQKEYSNFSLEPLGNWAVLIKPTDKKNTAKNTIIQAINDIKETNMFKNLFNKKEQKMEKDELKEIFMDCIQDVLKAQNEAEEEKKKIDDAEDEEKEEKAENKKACNEDKRKLIDEVAGMMKSAGCDDEVIRTAIAKMEKIGYDKSEAGTADNGKKAKCEDEEEKEEALNKAKNSIEVFKGLISQADVKKADSKYITKAQAIELGNQLF